MASCRLLSTTCRYCGKVTQVAYNCYVCGRIDPNGSPPDHACYHCLAKQHRLELRSPIVSQWRHIWIQAVGGSLFQRYVLRGAPPPPFPLDPQPTPPPDQPSWLVRLLYLIRRMVGMNPGRKEH